MNGQYLADFPPCRGSTGQDQNQCDQQLEDQEQDRAGDKHQPGPGGRDVDRRVGQFFWGSGCES